MIEIVLQERFDPALPTDQQGPPEYALVEIEDGEGRGVKFGEAWQDEDGFYHIRSSALDDLKTSWQTMVIYRDLALEHNHFDRVAVYSQVVEDLATMIASGGGELPHKIEPAAYKHGIPEDNRLVWTTDKSEGVQGAPEKKEQEQ
jgi:hypothetical protein